MSDLPYAAPGLLTRHRLGLHLDKDRAYAIVPQAADLHRMRRIEYPINNGNGMATRVVVDVQAEGRRNGGDWYKTRESIVHRIACNYHNSDVIEPLEPL